MPAGREAQPYGSATHQLFIELLLFWQGVENFMGGAGRRPCAPSADLQGRLSQGHEVVQ